MSLQFKFQCEAALNMLLLAVEKVLRMVKSVENHTLDCEAALNMLVLAWLLSRKCPQWSRVSRMLVLNSPHERLLRHQEVRVLLEHPDLFERICRGAELASRDLV